MIKIIDRVTEWLAESSGWLVSIIMILLVVDFVSRGLSKPIQGVSEMAVFVMVAVVYLGLGHCEQEKGHVRVEMFITKVRLLCRKYPKYGTFLSPKSFSAHRR